MELLLEILFALNFSLFVLHEMDAVRQKEWKLFVLLRDMKDSTAYRIFTGIHLLLYFIIIMLLILDKGQYKVYVSVGLDIFLIFHVIIHYIFKNKVNNRFNNIFSSLIINVAGVVSLVHIFIYFLGSIISSS